MADSKVTALTELTAAAASDILYIVDDPGGSPLSKKITVDNLVAGFDHGCSVTDASAQSIPHATWTTVNFDSEDWDTDAYHDTVTNNTRITIPSGQDGKYLITGIVGLESNTYNILIARILLNAVTAKAYGQDVGGGGVSAVHYVITTVILDLSATDYIELQINQNNAGTAARNTVQNSVSPYFMVHRIG